jgi:anti-anti-sigma factor
MPLDIKSSVEGTTARLTLIGQLDGASAPAVRTKVEELLTQKLDKLVLLLEDLSFMASAGLRIIIFAKQRQPQLRLYVIRPQEPIIETLKKTGFYDAVYVQDDEPADGATAS